jgi:hypothetical protein
MTDVQKDWNQSRESICTTYMTKQIMIITLRGVHIQGKHVLAEFKNMHFELGIASGRMLHQSEANMSQRRPPIRAKIRRERKILNCQTNANDIRKEQKSKRMTILVRPGFEPGTRET